MKDRLDFYKMKSVYADGNMLRGKLIVLPSFRAYLTRKKFVLDFRR